MPDLRGRIRSDLPVVGVDVGGTKTHLRAIVGGEVVDRIVPSELWRVGAITAR